ncbi:GNAT family N-acetyltransferase [Flavobacterium sp.]
MDITLRDANINDIPFLVETIIEAEKSGTDVFSYSTIFGLNEEESKKYIALMLEEEVDGCELSISSFLLADFNGKAIGAVCSWIEGLDGVPSTTLKANLLRFTLPTSSFTSLAKHSQLIKELHIEYVKDSIQIGLVYIAADARGKGLVQKLLTEKILQLKSLKPAINEVFVQVFGNNTTAIKAYDKIGFKIIETKIATSSQIKNYLPSDTKILMKLKL